MRKIGNRRGTEYDQNQDKACERRKQRDPARKCAWQKQQQHCCREGDVDCPGDHARLRSRKRPVLCVTARSIGIIALFIRGPNSQLNSRAI